MLQEDHVGAEGLFAQLGTFEDKRRGAWDGEWPLGTRQPVSVGSVGTRGGWI